MRIQRMDASQYLTQTGIPSSCSASIIKNHMSWTHHQCECACSGALPSSFHWPEIFFRNNFAGRMVSQQRGRRGKKNSKCCSWAYTLTFTFPPPPLQSPIVFCQRAWLFDEWEKCHSSIHCLYIYRTFQSAHMPHAFIVHALCVMYTHNGPAGRERLSLLRSAKYLLCTSCVFITSAHSALKIGVSGYFVIGLCFSIHGCFSFKKLF